MKQINPGFLFRSTGGNTTRDALDMRDNLSGELDRLRALRALIADCHESLEPNVLGGLAELLRDVEERMRAILDWFSA